MSFTLGAVIIASVPARNRASPSPDALPVSKANPMVCMGVAMNLELMESLLHPGYTVRVADTSAVLGFPELAW